MATCKLRCGSLIQRRTAQPRNRCPARNYRTRSNNSAADTSCGCAGLDEICGLADEPNLACDIDGTRAAQSQKWSGIRER